MESGQEKQKFNLQEVAQIIPYESQQQDRLAQSLKPVMQLSQEKVVANIIQQPQNTSPKAAIDLMSSVKKISSPLKVGLNELLEQKTMHDVFLKTQKNSLEIKGHHLQQSQKKISNISKGSQESLKQHVISMPMQIMKHSLMEEDFMLLSQENSCRGDRFLPV